MWYAIVDKKTLELYSVGTVLADPMPDKFKVVELGENFSETGKIWDKTTESFIEDRTQDWLVNKILELP